MMERMQLTLSREMEKMPSDEELLGRIALAEVHLDEIDSNIVEGHTNPYVQQDELITEFKTVLHQAQSLVDEANRRGLAHTFNSFEGVA